MFHSPPSTLCLILTSATQEDAWGQCKNRYLAKRREVPARIMGQHMGHEAGDLWPPTAVLGHGDPHHAKDGNLWVSTELIPHTLPQGTALRLPDFPCLLCRSAGNLPCGKRSGEHIWC